MQPGETCKPALEPFDHGALLTVGVVNDSRLVCRRRIGREFDREGTTSNPANLEVLDLVGKRDTLPLRFNHLDALERKPIRPSSRREDRLLDGTTECPMAPTALNSDSSSEWCTGC